MKKLILLLSVFTLSYSCSSDSNNSSNNNGNSFTNSMDYEFTITINGEVHKVKGNTTNGIPKGVVQSIGNLINNECQVLQSGGQKVVILKINDVTATNYISGQNLECQIILPNLLLGVNEAQVLFNGSYFDSVCTSLGAYSPGSGIGFSYFQSISGPFNSTLQRKIPITITDLGTTSTNHSLWSPTTPYNFGQTLKGNYSGTIYLSSNNSALTNYNIPVQISIDFKALRMY
ncbi:hypothetical protein [Flavobacterium sp.]|uniref:hypothetical protein n=1 Tax=Flavobacterium sp. TaxID=239 RepID=UPI0033427927